MTDRARNARLSVPRPLRWSLAALSQVAPPLAVRLAGEMFGRPHRSPRSAAEREMLASTSPFRLEAAGRRLAAWSWGNGPTVLLHHGWGGRGSQLAAFVPSLVEAGLSVVCYDAPAHGDSPGRTTNLPQIAHVMTEVIHRLGGVHGVLAHSLGTSAAAMAMRQGAVVGSAVFLAPPSNMRHYSDQFIQATGFTPRVQRSMETRFHRMTGIHMDELHAGFFARGQRTPLLVIYDRDDADVPAEQVRALVEAWDGARLVMTKGLGHRRILQDPQVVRQAVEFLSASPAESAPELLHGAPTR